MERRKFIQLAGLSTASLFLIHDQLFAGLARLFKGDILMLNDRVGIFTEKGGTIMFLITRKGIAVVDSQFPDTAPNLIEELKKKSARPFRYLINTHHHGDHTGGNIAFKGLVRHVVAHENSYTNQKNAAIKNNSLEKILLPDRIYGKEGWYRKLGGEGIQTYYFGEGHTNGDSIIHFEESNIAHMGDLIFNRRFPYIDKSAGASVKSWIRVLKRTVNTFDKETRFVFGHAAQGYSVTGNRDDINAFRNYLEKLYAFAEEELLKKGKSKEEFLKTKTIPGADEWKGDGIERSLNAIYEELVNKK